MGFSRPLGHRPKKIKTFPERDAKNPDPQETVYCICIWAISLFVCLFVLFCFVLFLFVLFVLFVCLFVWFCFFFFFVLFCFVCLFVYNKKLKKL